MTTWLALLAYGSHESTPVVLETKNSHLTFYAVRGSVKKSAASAASLDYVKFQALIKSAASAASLRGGRASGRLDHGYVFAIFGRTSGQKNNKK